MSNDSLATQALHADNGLDGKSDIALPIHLSTTFRYVYNTDQDESLRGPAPTGEALSIRRSADEAHKRGAYLIIDSTLGPPGLQDPFALGADIIMHSGTKCFGGHYDLLCGTLSIQPAREESWFKTLHEQRTILGSVLGSMEVWLGLRSLRTLELRVRRQSENATALVLWLYECLKSEFDYVVKKIVAAVRHASLQEGDMD
ncbi:hypothetical protein AFCA_006539 [Aspergillus flavus]|nr:hypothetical protein AFCA_006539 [Aspergillus flavus]